MNWLDIVLAVGLVIPAFIGLKRGIARLLRFIASAMMFGWVDHVGGAIVGFLVGVVVECPTGYVGKTFR